MPIHTAHAIVAAPEPQSWRARLSEDEAGKASGAERDLVIWFRHWSVVRVHAETPVTHGRIYILRHAGDGVHNGQALQSQDTIQL